MRKIISMLVVITLVVPLVSFAFPMHETQAQAILPLEDFDFTSLSGEYSDNIPVVVSFNSVLDQSTLSLMKELGIRFSLGSVESSKVGSYYLLRGSGEAFNELQSKVDIVYIGPQSRGHSMEASRDVSIPETNASVIWKTIDDFGYNVTGEDILIADLDSGVDWTHPDLWFADGSSYTWIDDDSDTLVSNGTDFIDIDSSTTGSIGEELYFIDLDHSGTYNTSTEWIWVDSIVQDGIPNINERFFVANDTNHDDVLNVGENLTMLSTPKTKYIVEGFGALTHVWERGVNLTTSTHEDTDGHGTAVSGILLGGDPAYRKYTGVAPGAELMMIKVLGSDFESLTIAEGLAWAYSHGADVILIEIGSWTYEYLDGSSPEEILIDTITAAGIPVIAPSGNLGGKDKHAMLTALPYTYHSLNFSIPSVGGPPTEGEYIDFPVEEVYITILSANTTDFSACNFIVTMNMGGTLTPIPLNSGIGMWNWASEPLAVGGGFTVLVESLIDISTRSTKMLAIRLTGTLPTTIASPWHSVNISAPEETVFHAYISDDQSSWTGGCIWKSNVFDGYEITWPSTADTALSVASYRTRDLLQPSWGGADSLYDIAGFSSRGPRIDETIKQGVAAPGGYDIITTYSNASQWIDWYNAMDVLPFGSSFASYQLFSGTSASGPHLAGCAALMLQANVSAKYEIADIIQSTARSDSFVDGIPNPEWGYGKLDVLSAVLEVNSALDTFSPEIGIPSQLPLIPNNTTDVTVSVSVTDWSRLSFVNLEYDNEVTIVNVTMTQATSLYSGIIPAQSLGTNVTFRVYASDSVGNVAVSHDYYYIVQDVTTTTTTTNTSTTTTGSTNTTFTGTNNTTGSSSIPTDATTPYSPDYLTLTVMLGAVLAFTVIACIVSRRRDR